MPISGVMTTLRSCLALLLTFVMLLTAQGMVDARGDTGAVGHMVICTGTGPVVIYVDDEGNPTEAPRYCPDALSVLLSPIVLAGHNPPAPDQVQTLRFVHHSTSVERQTGWFPQARGPPTAI